MENIDTHDPVQDDFMIIADTDISHFEKAFDNDDDWERIETNETEITYKAKCHIFLWAFDEWNMFSFEPNERVILKKVENESDTWRKTLGLIGWSY